jgi:hypothetical protein
MATTSSTPVTTAANRHPQPNASQMKEVMKAGMKTRRKARFMIVARPLRLVSCGGHVRLPHSDAGDICPVGRVAKLPGGLIIYIAGDILGRGI